MDCLNEKNYWEKQKSFEWNNILVTAINKNRSLILLFFYSHNISGKYINNATQTRTNNQTIIPFLSSFLLCISFSLSSGDSELNQAFLFALYSLSSCISLLNLFIIHLFFGSYSQLCTNLSKFSLFSLTLSTITDTTNTTIINTIQNNLICK